MPVTFLDGNEAIAHGALAAGCRFFAGYPITPATTLFNSMLKLLPAAGGICMQGEDEIGSIGFCLGASMAGWKVMTATSGPGISLYSENISFAIGSEIPVVIVNVQRLGPSTGSATRGADGDIQFLQWGNSGGLGGIVLSPVDVRDCYRLTMEAFNLAEQFRCPVFIASNKEIGMTRESVDLNSLEKPPVKYREAPPDPQSFRPFYVPDGRTVPYFLPMGGKTLVRQTSSTHGPDGFITGDANEISENRNRLKKKLQKVEENPFYEFHRSDNSKTLVITYGVTARAARTCFFERQAPDRRFSLLVLKTLWPVPEKLIQNLSKGVNRIVVAEMNLGQYLREIQRVLGKEKVAFLGRMDGRLIKPGQIQEVLANG